MKKLLLVASLILSSGIASTSVHAEGSMQHFGQSAQNAAQSAKHSAATVGETLIGTSKLVSGVAAVPFKALGAVGHASGAIGDLLWENAAGTEPLEVTEDTVTVGPAPFVAVNH